MLHFFCSHVKEGEPIFLSSQISSALWSEKFKESTNVFVYFFVKFVYFVILMMNEPNSFEIEHFNMFVSRNIIFF